MNIDNIDNVYTDSIRIGLSNGGVFFQLSPILNKFHENILIYTQI